MTKSKEKHFIEAEKRTADEWRSKWFEFESVFKEVNFEYFIGEDTLVVSAFGAQIFGFDEVVRNAREKVVEKNVISVVDLKKLFDRIELATPDSPMVKAVVQTLFDGRWCWCNILLCCFFDGDKLVRLLGNINEIDEIYRERIAFGYAANHDELTGLYRTNRARQKIEEKLSGDFYTYAVAIFDIDRFKEINDEYGHVFGDKVLKRISANAAGSVVKEDGELVARVGGDEFMVFLKYSGDPSERCGAFFRSLACEVDGVKVSVSMGISDTSIQGRDFAVLYDCADRALYASKRSGRGACYFYKAKADENIYAKI